MSRLLRASRGVAGCSSVRPPCLHCSPPEHPDRPSPATSTCRFSHPYLTSRRQPVNLLFTAARFDLGGWRAGAAPAWQLRWQGPASTSVWKCAFDDHGAGTGALTDSSILHARMSTRICMNCTNRVAFREFRHYLVTFPGDLVQDLQESYPAARSEPSIRYPTRIPANHHRPRSWHPPLIHPEKQYSRPSPRGPRPTVPPPATGVDPS
jgi:hypothetical protein